MITHSTTYSTANGGSIPQWFYLAPGTYTWRLELWELFACETHVRKTDEETITFYVKHTLTVSNSFGSGTIYIDFQNKSSGSSAKKLTGETLAVGAIDQSSGGIDYIWNSSGINNSQWKRKRKNESSHNGISAFSRNHNYTVQSNDNAADIQASMKAKYNVTFANSFVGINPGGTTLKVNGSNYSSPTAQFQVVQLNNISAEAQPSHVINHIRYFFDKWSDGTQSSSTTFTVNNHTEYKAEYIGRPMKESINLRINDDEPGNDVRLNWDEHPNTGVTKYKIYRAYKGGDHSFSDPELIATRNRGTLSYTDYQFTIGGSNPITVGYDVVPYYSVEGTEALIGVTFTNATRDIIIPKTADTTATTNNNVISDFALSNFPNPFNPSTVINYSIPSAQTVKILIYNILGEKVKELVNSSMEAGSYSVQWNGDNQFGRKVNSGVYFSVLQTQEKRIVKKMILSK